MATYIGNIPVPQATQTRQSFTATASQTTFATAGYTAGFIDVYLNGVKLAAADYTATNGSDVVLAVGAAEDDILETVAYSAFTVADQTFTGDIVMSDGLTVDNDGATVLTVDRATSDGTLVDFQKNGTSVGSIGATGGDLHIGTGITGIRFRDGINAVGPSNGTVDTDAATDLGATGNRFKNLYLSGGVYLGGTGASNHLDDYEEGTWTPTVGGTTTDPTASYSSNNGQYTKIGNLVVIRFYMQLSAISGGSGTLKINGIPFTTSSQSGIYGASHAEYIGISMPSNRNNIFIRTNVGGQNHLQLEFMDTRASQTAGSGPAVTISDVNSGLRVLATVTYQTDS